MPIDQRDRGPGEPRERGIVVPLGFVARAVIWLGRLLKERAIMRHEKKLRREWKVLS